MILLCSSISFAFSAGIDKKEYKIGETLRIFLSDVIEDAYYGVKFEEDEYYFIDTGKYLECYLGINLSTTAVIFR
ncbi:hypothetical protein ACFLTD_05475 [Elusimicrobiota bacterium]